MTEHDAVPSTGFTVPAELGPEGAVRPGTVTAAAVVAFACAAVYAADQVLRTVLPTGPRPSGTATAIGLVVAPVVVGWVGWLGTRLLRGRLRARTKLTALAVIAVLMGASAVLRAVLFPDILANSGALFLGTGLVKIALGVAMFVLLRRPATIRYCSA
ncbi:hypothetical protein R8Z50_28505 [Longispora sp. K20-0274]|uniref:hypothetical protein n=1 Tax=Longispora sp. K20-0274 TaxID=3088255 RepID=UPI00399BF7E2